MSREEIKSDIYGAFAAEREGNISKIEVGKELDKALDQTRTAALKEVMEWVKESDNQVGYSVANGDIRDEDAVGYRQALTDLRHHLTQMLGDNK